MISFLSKSGLHSSKALMVAVFSLYCGATIAVDAQTQDIGKQIYLTGHTSSGEAIQAIVGGNAPVNGDQFSCVSCHRRSRLGSSEGGKQVPPLTATALFKPAQMSVTRGVLPKAFKHSGSTRIPYTEESLAKAIREGVDPSGRKLDPLMPRYALDADAIAALTAYLETDPSSNPGVDEASLHFATVITEGVDPVKRKAMLDILAGYFQDKNADTRHNTKRAKFSAYKMYQVYRKWELHVWELKGDESTWPTQLEDYYRSQPVLAMVGGLSASGWQPIHQFCEQFEVACLFPNTDVPVISESDFYTTYFSKGLTLEAETLASHLKNINSKAKNLRIIQVYRGNGQNAVPAKALREALQKTDSFNLQDIAIADSQPLTPKFWDDQMKKLGNGILVLWLNKEDLENLNKLPSGITTVYGSANLIDGQIQKLSDTTKANLYLIYPWELPDTKEPRLMRVKSWLKSKQIPFVDEHLQANTFFSVQILGEVITHLLDNFSSAYIVERVEGMLGTLSSRSIYPHLSLGAGQRFASKGSYIVKVSHDGHLVPVEDWIIP
ncbi:MAG: cytochrome C [Methyloglobulus sp.]|nr:cytochrome C [Methyloglobulus sp.]